ncbi:MAG: hypothetical protein ABI591_07985 [Kofleriaceae bacterium]
MKLLWLLALPGCAQLFGLDDTTGGAVDAPGPGVHFGIQLEQVGATIVDTPDDPAVTHDTVAFLVPNGESYQTVPATLSTAGAWTGDIATGNPLVDFTIDGTRHIWNVPTRDLKMTSAALGHPSPVAPPNGSVFNLSITVAAGLTGTELLSFLTVGAWSQQSIPAAMAGAGAIADQLMYTAATAVGGPLAKITPTDAVLVLRRRMSSTLDGTYPLDGVFQTSIDQTGTDALSGSLADTAVDKMISAQIAPTALATRYAAVRPAIGSLALGWSCVAAPGYQRGLVNGPTLNDGGILASATTITGAYGNPFASLGWKELLFYNSYETRTVTLPGAQTFGLSAGLQTIVQPMSGQTFDMPAGLPQTISLNDMPLTSDNMAVYVDPAKYVHITMVNDRTTNTFVQAELFEVLTPDAMTVTTKLVLDALAVDPTALVMPPDVFVAGHTYFIQAITRQGGWPNAATGDFQTQAPPFYVGYNYSGVFTVSTTP